MRSTFVSGSLGILGSLLLCGCWQGPRSVAQLPPPRVEVLPAAAAITVGRAQAFSVRVDGVPTAKGVAWSVVEPGGGRVGETGLYQAPAAPGTYTVRAGFQGGAGTAKVTVVARPAGDIQAPARVPAGAGDQVARIEPVSGSTYAWTLTGGRILTGADSPIITFQAGAGPKLDLGCKVTNAAGDVLNSSLEIPVAAPVALAITPTTATLTTGRTMKFGYSLGGGTTQGVIWSLGEPGCGSLDDSGHYTAPLVPGTYTVRVTSRDEPAKAAVAQVKVVAKPPESLFVPASFQPGAGNLRAEVPDLPGMTYAWDIQGGTIVSGAAGPVLIFQAGPGPTLTLRCRITNEAGDAFTAVKDIPAAQS
jgi:hypothetical protein